MKITQISLLAALVISFSACSHSNNNVVIESLGNVSNVKTLRGMREVAFEWEPVYDQNIDGFKIFRNEISDTVKDKKLIATLKDKYNTHYTDTKLQPDTEYSYSIVGFNRHGISKENVINVKTMPKIAPVPYIQAITGLPNKIKIIWRPHPDYRVVKYNLYRQDVKSDKWSRIATIDNRLSAEYIDNVKPNVYARYKISAVTFDDIESDLSDLTEAKSKILPPQVNNINASMNLPRKIMLSWDAPSYDDFAYYKIYYSSSKFLPFSELAKVKDNTYEDLLNSDGASRYYYVTMVDKDGLESAKTGVNVIGMTLGKPKAPVLTGFDLVSENAIKVKWINSDTRAVGFKVLKNNQEVVSNLKTNFYIDNSYNPGDVYQVISIDEYSIESKPSDKLSVK